MLMLLLITALIIGLLSVSSTNRDMHYPVPRQTYPPGGFGYDYDREYYRYRREREYKRLVATLVFIVLLVTVFAVLTNAA